MRLGFLAFLFSVLSLASQIEVKGRNFVVSCSHYSTVEGDFEIQFEDRNLPWGTRVFLVTALSGEELLDREKIDWREKIELEMKPSAAYRWKAEFPRQLHERTSSIAYTKVVFVFRIESPGQAPLWNNGGSLHGYYQTEVWKPGTSECITSVKEKPEMRNLPFEVVRKDD